MLVSVFGNPDLKEDSLVVKLVPQLKKALPQATFRIEDPAEGLNPPVGGGLWVILDVAQAIDKVMVFDDLDKLESLRRVSLHDYDVAMELKLLKKVGKIKKIKIICVPMEMNEKKVLKEIINILTNLGKDC